MGKIGSLKGSVKVVASGIRGGNGVLCCQNLVRTGAGDGLRTLKRSEWAEIEKKTGEMSSEGEKIVHETSNHGSVRIFCRKEGVLQVTTGDFTPSDGNLRDVNPLGDKDMKNFSKLLEEAYESLNAQAGNGKLHFEPVMIRYRLLDSDGKTIYKSVPQIACGEEGWQLADIVEADVTKRSDENFTIGSINLWANAYSLWVELPESEERSEARELAIDMSYPLHPVDFEKDAEIRVAQASGNNPKARIGLPGTTSGMMSLNEQRIERVRKLAARADEVMRTVAVYTLGNARILEIQRNSAVSVGVVRQIEDKALAKEAGIATEDDAVVEVNLPNGFEASGMATSGDTVLYFGVKARKYEGRVPSETVDCGEGDDEIDLCVKTRLAGGKTVSRKERVRGDFAAVKVNPMTGYQSRKAIAEEITASCGGVTKGISLSLLPTEDGSQSIAVADGLKWISLEEEYEKWEESGDENDTERERRNMLLCASTGDPRKITGAVELEGRINDCKPTERTQGSWDSSKGHFYVTTDCGIEGVTATGKTGSIGVMRLCECEESGKLTQGEGVTFTATETGILRLKGGAVSVMKRDKRVRALSWLPETGMLLAVRDDGSRYLMDNDGTRYDLTKEGDDVCWTVTTRHERGERLKRLTVDMRTDNFDGEISVTGYGKGINERIACMKVKRAVREPIELGGILSPWRWMTVVTVKGKMGRSNEE